MQSFLGLCSRNIRTRKVLGSTGTISLLLVLMKIFHRVQIDACSALREVATLELQHPHITFLVTGFANVVYLASQNGHGSRLQINLEV